MHYQAIAITSFFPAIKGFKVDPTGATCPIIRTPSQFQYIAKHSKSSPNTDFSVVINPPVTLVFVDPQTTKLKSNQNDLSIVSKTAKFPMLAAWIDRYLENNVVDKSRLSIHQDAITASEDAAGSNLDVSTREITVMDMTNNENQVCSRDVVHDFNKTPLQEGSFQKDLSIRETPFRRSHQEDAKVTSNEQEAIVLQQQTEEKVMEQQYQNTNTDGFNHDHQDKDVEDALERQETFRVKSATQETPHGATEDQQSTSETEVNMTQQERYNSEFGWCDEINYNLKEDVPEKPIEYPRTIKDAQRTNRSTTTLAEKGQLAEIVSICDKFVDEYRRHLPHVTQMILSHLPNNILIPIFVVIAICLEMHQRKLKKLRAQDKIFIKEEQDFVRRKNELIASVEKQNHSGISSSAGSVDAAKLAIDQELEKIVNSRDCQAEEIKHRLEATIQRAISNSRLVDLESNPISAECHTVNENGPSKSSHSPNLTVGTADMNILPKETIQQNEDITDRISVHRGMTVETSDVEILPIETTKTNKDITDSTSVDRGTVISIVPVSDTNNSISDDTLPANPVDPVLIKKSDISDNKQPAVYLQNNCDPDKPAKKPSASLHPTASASEIPESTFGQINPSALALDLATISSANDADSTLPALVDSPSETSESMEASTESKSCSNASHQPTKKKKIKVHKKIGKFLRRRKKKVKSDETSV